MTVTYVLSVLVLVRPMVGLKLRPAARCSMCIGVALTAVGSVL